MSENSIECLSPIDEPSRESRDDSSSPDRTEVTSDAAFWTLAVARHAESALDFLAALQIPEHSVAHDATLAVDRILANADAACADDLRNTQQLVHQAYEHAEHTPALAARLAALDSAAAWRLAQYLYDQNTSVPCAHDLEPRLRAIERNAREREVTHGTDFHVLRNSVAAARQHTDDRVHDLYGSLYQQIQYDMQSTVDARVARTSLALFEQHRAHEKQIADLHAAYADLEEKYDALNETIVLQSARAKPAKRWSIFSSADADASANVSPTSPTLKSPPTSVGHHLDQSPIASPLRR
jgi:hypothetical protein